MLNIVIIARTVETMGADTALRQTYGSHHCFDGRELQAIEFKLFANFFYKCFVFRGSCGGVALQ